jgi:hypothetical protein
MEPVMSPLSPFTLFSCTVFASGALALAAVEIERLRARRMLATALVQPQTVEKAWVSPPDDAGLRCLFVKAVGATRPRAVAMDFEVDDIVRRFSLAGIRIGFEHEALAAWIQAAATPASHSDQLIDKVLAQEQDLFIIASSVERRPHRPRRPALPRDTPPRPPSRVSMRPVPKRIRIAPAAAKPALRSLCVSRFRAVRNAATPFLIPL